MTDDFIRQLRACLSNSSISPRGDEKEEGRAEKRPVPDVLTQAAVLIPLVAHQNKISVLLTRRSDHLYHHPGQISFPGGSVEEQDASVEQAALRETCEEIGLPPERIELLGTLPFYSTITGFHVSPVVGMIRGAYELQLDAFEVAEAFEVPWEFLINPANYQRHRIERDGVVRYFEAVPYAGRFIWGATAGMLSMLRHCIEQN